ncbi:MAG: hypothetical protein IPJ90_22630 [Anaerolineaceae bacterium]|nr:hypothetical protein [Anaerolineaceae bacterium]
MKLANIKFTSPSATVLRLASGPTLLYTMLVFVQAGLNPLHTPLLLCLGNIAFLPECCCLADWPMHPTIPG